MNKKFLLSISTAALLITGCGGGGGGGGGSAPSNPSNPGNGGSSTPITITGYAIDPAIKGAEVSFNCNGTIYTAPQNTDSSGAFTINIPASVNLSTCMLRAYGGRDGADNLTGLTLRAPYNLYGRNSGLYITPFTTAVAEHDSATTDIEAAKTEVANFFEVSKEELSKNPMSNIKLLRKTRKITKLAKKKDKNGKLVGYLDIDNTSIVKSSTFDSFYNNDIQDIVSPATKAELDNEYTDIDNANSVDEMRLKGINEFVDNTLKAGYKFTDDTYKEKLEYLRTQIVEANKDDIEYLLPTRAQIRKALFDAELVPSFKEDDITTISDELKAKFDVTLAKFKEELDKKTINIKDIDDFDIIDSNTFESIVGNDNAKRLAYYTISDKSNISKLLNLAKDVYSDAVNDPIYGEISKALINAGLTEEATENIRDNVYTPSEQRSAYKEAGKAHLALNQNTEASDLFYEEFNVLKRDIEAKGKENFKGTDQAAVQGIARYLGEANDPIRANEVITYLEDLAVELNDTSSYSRVVQGLEDIAEDTYLYNNDFNNARDYAKRAAQKVVGIPTSTKKTAVYYTYRTAITAAAFSEPDFARAATENAKKIDPTLADVTSPSGAYQEYPIAVEGLMGEFDSALSKFNNLVYVDSRGRDKSDSEKRYALDLGFAAGLYLNGKADELFNTYYTNSSIYTRKYYITDNIRIGQITTLSNANIIKLLGTPVQLEDYLDRMDALAQTWTLTSANDTHKVYAYWGSEPKFRTGYLAMASFYKDLNKISKAENILTQSVNKMSALLDMKYKIDGLVDISEAMNELKIGKSEDKTKMLDELYNAANTSSYETIDRIIKAANVLSANARTNEAKTLIDRAKALVPDLISEDKSNIEKRAKYLVGIYNNSTNSHKNSIANAYFQAGFIDEAKNAITEATTSIETLGDTVDAYELYIDIAKAYANINNYNKILPIINRIKTNKENELARTEAAESLASYDAFQGVDIASVDSDNDKKPDFFNFNATKEQIDASGLILDEDIDNDGNLDTVDTLPYDKVSL